jgi:hypothetical protein
MRKSRRSGKGSKAPIPPSKRRMNGCIPFPLVLLRVGEVKSLSPGSRLVSCERCRADLWFRQPLLDAFRDRPELQPRPICRQCASLIWPDLVAEMRAFEKSRAAVNAK